MECSDNNINNINIIKESSPKKNNINNILPIIKNKSFIDNFDSFIFGYLLGNILKDFQKPIEDKLIENIYSEYQKQNKLPFEIIYRNINTFISSSQESNNNKIIPNLNLNKDDSDNNFTLFDTEDNPNNNCNIININEIDNYLNINENNDNKVKESIIGPEDYEDYNVEEEEQKGKCLICLEEYQFADNDNYYLDCGCIVHGTCFDDYIENAINEGKVPIKCPYCNKEDVNELYIKDSLNKNNKINLVEKFEKFNMNYSNYNFKLLHNATSRRY